MKRGKYIGLIILSGIFFTGTEWVAAEKDMPAEELKLYQISEKKFDCNVVCETLFREMQTEKEVLQNGGITVRSGEGVLWMGDGDISYEKNTNASKENRLIFQYLNSEICEEYWKNEDIEENKEIYNRITNICKLNCDEELKLVHTGNFDKKILEEMQKKLKEYGQDLEIDVWNAEKYTALEYELYKDGIPIMGLNEPRQGYYIELFGADPLYVRVLAGDGEILCLDIQGMFEANESERVEILTEEEALHIAEKEMEEVISDYTWEISNVKLEYVPIPDWSDEISVPEELVPYWCVTRIRNNGEDTSEDAVRINAITGASCIIQI